ncbi:serine-rich adhesin for platelets-like isoform X2 [Argopecten irradians]|uniref:serine-rich adhesin for platelets-like isoform X2 n=1 Tax=Argopecten irradians TaxID=31199 RepID=UPI0037147350
MLCCLLSSTGQNSDLTGICDEDPRIQKKTKELWEEKMIEWRREEDLKKCQAAECHQSEQNQSMSSEATLTQLLEAMAQVEEDSQTSRDLVGETTKQDTQRMQTRNSSKTTQQNTQDGTNSQTTNKKTTNKATQKERSGKTIQDFKRPFEMMELLIPSHEQVILQEIAEWKESYMPERSTPGSSEETGSGDKAPSYVPHTLVDDESSIETTGQPSPTKKRKQDRRPVDGTDNLEKSAIPQTLSEGNSDPGTQQQAKTSAPPETSQNLSTQGNSDPGSPQQAKVSASPRTRQNLSKQGNSDPGSPHQAKVYASPRTRHNLSTQGNPDPGSPHQAKAFATPRSRQNLSTHGNSANTQPFQESQGFVPCLSPENVSSERVNVLLEQLEMEEEVRLRKLATPSDSFRGYNSKSLEKFVNDHQESTIKKRTCHINSDRDTNEDEAFNDTVVDKTKTGEKVYNSSSQTDSDSDIRVTKRRRLAFSNAKQKLGTTSSPHKKKNIDRTLIGHDITGQSSLEEDVLVLNSPESQKQDQLNSENTSNGTDDNLQHPETTTAKNSNNETIKIPGSSESMSSSENSPSVLTFKRRRRESDLISSLPSYQPPMPNQSQDEFSQPENQSQKLSVQTLPSQAHDLSLETLPSQSQDLSPHELPSQSLGLSLNVQTQSSQSQDLSLSMTLEDKVKLLCSITDITPTGRKLLEMNFCDRLLEQITTYYIDHDV